VQFNFALTTATPGQGINEQLLFGTSPATVSMWTNTVGSSWGVATNWSAGIPQNAGDVANFLGAITGPATVTLDGTRTVGSITFSNSNPYTIATGSGGGLLVLDNGGINSTAGIDDANGNDFIPANIVLNSPTAITVANAANTLSISGKVSGAGGLSLSGSGTLSLSASNSYGGSTNVLSGFLLVGTAAALPSTTSLNIGSVGEGQVRLTDGGGTATLAGLTINTSNSSTLNITDDAVVVTYTSSDPLASIRSYLTTGYAGGKWNGTAGIVSTSVASLQASQSRLVYSIGYADSDDHIITGLPSGEIFILPTLAGDAKMQGNVVFGDFQVLAEYFGQSQGWDAGNFTYQSTVNFGDFQLLAQDFGSTSSGLTSSELTSMNSFAAQFGESLVPNSDGVGFQVVSVPEPASVGLLAMTAMGVFSRRRRRR
jgi:autotransporter-associated beta strand protein